MQPNPRKTKSVLELGAVDIEALKAAVLSIPETVWARENAIKPNRFEALYRTSHIVFRFLRSLKDWRTYYDLPRWPEFRDLVEPVMARAVGPYGYGNGVFPRIMLARIDPGGMIEPHIDANIAALWPHKIHVPLQTNDKVSFLVQPNVHHLHEGEAYEVNNMTLHGVRNDGQTPRIHLIFEYYDADQPVA
jgi:Aspartyl/Asparaginyl beta-hydroxylase